ncbi:hypothetical protein [Dyella sedimenti]|uniref:hypothetical protein n=1 Tax=Dyella sedimenti TaxID=2919947 RepID=UPI001FAA5AD3|nr:hypothetical protein [Dyella sedimenti]
MLPSAKWCAGAISWFAVALLLASCGKKDLSPPAVNASPHEKLELVVTPEGDEGVYAVTVSAQYGNLSKDCSNIDYRYGLGGNIDYPKGNVAISWNKGTFEIYRDYYEPRVTCSWKLLGVDITIHALNGRHASTGISQRDFQAGFQWEVKCIFGRSDVDSCFPLSASREHMPGIHVAIRVK